MARTQLSGRSRPGPDVFEALAHRRRRTIVDILLRRSPLGVDELARYVVAAETDKPRDEVTPDAAENVLLSLRHIHLPKLEAVDLVTRTDGYVVTARPPALGDAELEQIVRTAADDWDEVLACLADRCRRVALSTLHDRDSPMSRRELAGMVASRLATRPNRETRTDEEEVLLQLHHLHLPMLDSAGLIDYDRSSTMVRYVGHPDLTENWL